MPSKTEITPSQLDRLIGTPRAPVLIDVCIDEDFEADPRLIPTAFRWPHRRIEALAGRLAGRRVVVIRQKGLKLSQGAAAILRAGGVRAESLRGGNLAWRDAGLPLIPAAAVPAREGAGETGPGRTLWATRRRPGIDRIASPWLIRRFVDPAARFLFVAPGEMAAVAEKFGAAPFDVAGVHWTHRGDGCTFDAMIEDFALKTAPVLALADIVRGADAGGTDTTPQSAGLLAASLGPGALHGDDLARLEAGVTLHDAFYRWARDARGETRDRTPEAAA